MLSPSCLIKTACGVASITFCFLLLETRCIVCATSHPRTHGKQESRGCRSHERNQQVACSRSSQRRLSSAPQPGGREPQCWLSGATPAPVLQPRDSLASQEHKLLTRYSRAQSERINNSLTKAIYYNVFPAAAPTTASSAQDEQEKLIEEPPRESSQESRARERERDIPCAGEKLCLPSCVSG